MCCSAGTPHNSDVVGVPSCQNCHATKLTEQQDTMRGLIAVTSTHHCMLVTVYCTLPSGGISVRAGEHFSKS